MTHTTLHPSEPPPADLQSAEQAERDVARQVTRQPSSSEVFMDSEEEPLYLSCFAFYCRASQHEMCIAFDLSMYMCDCPPVQVVPCLRPVEPGIGFCNPVTRKGIELVQKMDGWMSHHIVYWFIELSHCTFSGGPNYSNNSEQLQKLLVLCGGPENQN